MLTDIPQADDSAARMHADPSARGSPIVIFLSLTRLVRA
jgi:hypothetical protein